MSIRSIFQGLFLLYTVLFVRRFFYKLHYALFKIGLHGIGVQNLHNRFDLSGEHHFLRRYLRGFNQQPLVFDVGANEGQYLRAVKGIAPHAMVHSFEPHPQTFERLKAGATFSDVQLNNLGCGAIPAEAELFDYDRLGSQHASIHTGVFENVHNTRPISLAIRITTIDEYCQRHDIRNIDLLKIDTEGHEYAVLQGASALLHAGGIAAIHFEFNEMNVYSRVYFRDFLDLLPDFDFYRMLPDGLIKLGPYRADLFELFAYQNIVALRCSSRRVEAAA